MEWAAVLAFWAVSMLMALTPGADWAYAISSGLGRRSPLPGVLGLLTGHLAGALAVAAGLGAAVASLPSVLTVATFVGGGYLVYAGVAGLLAAGGTEASGREETSARGFRRGLAVTALNPKVLLLFVALLPQFVNRASAWPVGLQLLALGLLHVGTTAVVYLGVGWGARWLLRSRPAAERAVKRISGAVMIGLGATLLVERILAL